LTIHFWNHCTSQGGDEIEEFLTGARHEPHDDRVLATFVFTDIVGSTEPAARLGDRGWRNFVRSTIRRVGTFKGVSDEWQIYAIAS
jgi:hypothetical protein